MESKYDLELVKSDINYKNTTIILHTHILIISRHIIYMKQARIACDETFSFYLALYSIKEIKIIT